MRYYHKKQLIALQRALIKLTTYYGQQSVSNVMDTVDSCYSLIDSLDVVNKETLAFTLTNVRDTLSDVSKRAETKRLSAFNGVNQLFTHISEIKRCISEEDVEFEIVFFPYKASMWDCMESVWREVKKNKNCKCSVIPVPYYKLDKDGNNTEFCYEGEKFPDEVPIVSYSEYNLEEQHPDIVYFHNPYDQYNLVTRVLDEYFSSNLKNILKSWFTYPIMLREVMTLRNRQHSYYHQD
ncbi:CDP-glycerol:poly(glycerophosphate) glycerophosphotransferase [Sporolactobacillus inulinus]|uniref:CDP-glycerol:poly(Glycerophosphate) glycerophosphotransferase n=1 Tax=Sporolactobacillus inulinus TaxID=2078 RepID=A0A4Y1ZFR9_9BACL|nr:hypothetical protein [Sporolactobacillus inulinus]GAY77997.1 CDP-glycerol:poly(glycerophosphate) glycerophosphotransferase [Sporolactobacillus inulinus]